MNRIAQAGTLGFAQGIANDGSFEKTRLFYRRVNAAKLAADLPEDRKEALALLEEAARLYDAMHDPKASPFSGEISTDR